MATPFSLRNELNGGINPIKWDRNNQTNSVACYELWDNEKTLVRTQSASELIWTAAGSTPVFGKAYVEVAFEVLPQSIYECTLGWANNNKSWTGTGQFPTSGSLNNTNFMYFIPNSNTLSLGAQTSWTDDSTYSASPSGLTNRTIFMLAIDSITGDAWIGQDGTWLGGGDPGAGTGAVANDGGNYGTYHVFMSSYVHNNTPTYPTHKYRFTSGNYDCPTGFTRFA